MSNFSPLPGPPSRLRLLDKTQRDAIHAAVLNSSEMGIVWLEKFRRFASLYGRNLRHEAKKRFHAETDSQLVWMANLLLQGGERSPERGRAPVDPATLSSALYCLDATRSDHGLSAQVERQISLLSDWLVKDAPQPPQRAPLGAQFSYQNGLWAKEARHSEGIVIVAPNPFSLYAISVLEIFIRLHIPVQAILIRNITIQRFAQEWRRDGPRLLKKAWRKLILRADESSVATDVSLKFVFNALKPKYPDVRKRAREMNIPVLEVNSFEDAVSPLKAVSPSLAVFTGGGLIKGLLFEVFMRGILNIHMGNLPQYRGMDVVQASILDGCYEDIGLTGHLMVPELDSGPVLSRFAIDSSVYSYLGGLRNELAALMPLIAIDTTLGLFSGRLSPQKQPPTGRQYYFVHPGLENLVQSVLKNRCREDASKKSTDICLEVERFFNDRSIF